MVVLPNPTIDRIYQTYVDARAKEPVRDYLGCSELGEECSRRLWYSFRHVDVPMFEGRILRLFDTGKKEEDRVIADLRNAGITVYDRDENGQQFRYSACNGHLSGGLDGVVVGLPESPETPHVLEIKTHNKKSFDDFEKNGVEKSKPVHYAQCQLYTGLSDLQRAAYFAVCKDDDRLQMERIHFQAPTYKALLLKADRIINAESAPNRLSEDPSFFKCKFCPFAGTCHGDKIPNVNCRTCVHSSPVEDAKWSCAMGREMWPCDGHLFIPSLLHWAEALDGDPTFIRYKIKSTGREFVNVADVGFPALDLPHYGSKELSACQVAAIGHPAVEAARTILEGEVVLR